MNLEPNVTLENLEGIAGDYRALFAAPANTSRENTALARHHPSITLPEAEDARVAAPAESVRIERVADSDIRWRTYHTRSATLGVGAMVVLLRRRNG
jgi:hypothetical protein